ncbi:cold shock domain-containing protein [Myceligenerans xiligouense]|uniref:Putative cold-shock DNA-binding protein n=1 Tax=Myceligenerans xiligouense TaxID=253184 RepID=A0A3N4YSM1_9MICO|nr:cold shock domain-containing protein [Myceligenerans xiligouense]RPF22506.1 putative cold-shock DNA-binding protein [Myceligenerans xiligouense]
MRVVQGRVIRYDEVRGYGFVAPDEGGDDVFLHVNDLEFDKRKLVVGAVVEFDTEEGDRGPKASQVTLVSTPVAQPQAVAAAPGNGTTAVLGGVPAPAPTIVLPDTGADDGDSVTGRQLTAELTEMLLAGVPTLTAEQVVLTRQAVVALAAAHGWVSDDPA